MAEFNYTGSVFWSGTSPGESKGGWDKDNYRERVIDTMADGLTFI